MQPDIKVYLNNFFGRPYVWGGDGYSGFDCSGLVLETLYAFGIYEGKDLSAQGIYDWALNNTGNRIELLFFGKDKRHISHVAMRWNEYQMIEAGGGGRNTINKGMVRLRPITWRKDLVDTVIV